MDIECINIDSKQVPYCVGIYNDISGYNIFYGQNCMKNFIDYIDNMNNNIYIYAHN
jgi:hypothetical protein